MNTLKKFQSAKDAGFTIFELLVVLIIIGILSGIAYVGLSSARNNSVQDSCKAGYQAIYLGIAGYQTDHLGAMPGSVTAMEPNYISASTVESYSKNFTLHLGSFNATSYDKPAGGIATINFIADYQPQMGAGDKLVVANVDSVTSAPQSINGTWVIQSVNSSLIDPNDSTKGWRASVSFKANYTASNGGVTTSSAGGYINAITKQGDPFDIYVFNPKGERVGTTAPAACSSL